MKKLNHLFPISRRRWFKLDNAAKLYPAISNARWSSVFRLSFELYEPVDPLLLQQAADRVLLRFPALKVRMKCGLFWRYLEEIPFPLTVRRDTGHPCMPFHHRQDHGYLMRIFYYDHRVSAEFFHSLTDGTGALVFIKTLAVEYLRLSGHGEVRFDQGALDIETAPAPEETEDVFIRRAWPRVRFSRRETKAYHLPATREIPHTLHLIAASLPCEQVTALARGQGVTVTEYFVSVILWTAYRRQKDDGIKNPKPIRVSVPVNLRRFFPSPTLRNFSSFVNVGIDPRLGEYDFPEICRAVHAAMRYQADPKMLAKAVSANVADEKNLFMRLAPLFLKDAVIAAVFRRNGDRIVTSTISNLGKTSFPTGGEAYLKRFEFHLGAPAGALYHLGILSSGNELRVLFTGNIMETDLPREVLRHFTSLNVLVSVESNQEEE